jgi:hypothetical protein
LKAVAISVSGGTWGPVATAVVGASAVGPSFPPRKNTKQKNKTKMKINSIKIAAEENK